MDVFQVGKIAQKTWIRIKEQIEIERESRTNEKMVQEEDEVQMTDDEIGQEEEIEMDD